MEVAPVSWRVKLPIIAAAMVLTFIIGHAFSWSSEMGRAVGVAVAVGWINWIGGKGSPVARRLALVLGWMVAAGLASLLLDWLL
jgi:hypothetical protein